MRLVHAIAKCRDCDWECGYKNAMLLAGKHNKKTGHEIFVELGFSHIYKRNKIIKANKYE